MFCLLERASAALSENRLLVSLLARARELAIPVYHALLRSRYEVCYCCWRWSTLLYGGRRPCSRWPLAPPADPCHDGARLVLVQVCNRKKPMMVYLPSVLAQSRQYWPVLAPHTSVTLSNDSKFKNQRCASLNTFPRSNRMIR